MMAMVRSGGMGKGRVWFLCGNLHDDDVESTLANLWSRTYIYMRKDASMQSSLSLHRTFSPNLTQ